jgi:hypothetical protein
MKPPTEADLIDLENTALRHYREIVGELGNSSYTIHDRVVSTLEYLIARARFHNQRQPSRNGKSEPVSSLQPKQKSEPKNR